MFRPTRRPSSGLQISKRLNIASVWQMLRSHHQACKLYMRQELRMNRLGGGRAAGVRYPGRGGQFPLAFVGFKGGEVRMAISSLYVSHVWRWRSVE